MLKVLTVVVGAIEENCYIIYDAGESRDDGLKPCVLVDPGDEPDRIKNEMEALGLCPHAILLTHAHYDHIGAVRDLLDSYPSIPIYACKDEKVIIESSYKSGLGTRTNASAWSDKVTYLDDRTVLSLLGSEWELISTPGHTAGSCCYYIEGSSLLFAGDTLFAGSCGRTDFPTGSMRAIINSIQNVLMKLPDDTIVLPGHMGSTTIGAEKKYNFIMRM